MNAFHLYEKLTTYELHIHVSPNKNTERTFHVLSSNANPTLENNASCKVNSKHAISPNEKKKNWVMLVTLHEVLMTFHL